MVVPGWRSVPRVSVPHVNQQSSALVLVHIQLNLLGFLDLTIIGTAYQFYPPAVGNFPRASDYTALVSIASLASGPLIQVIGLVGQFPSVPTLGQLMTLGGALLYAFLIVAVFTAR